MVTSPDKMQNSQPYTVLGKGKADMESYRATGVLEPCHLTNTSCLDISIYQGDTSLYEIV